MANREIHVSSSFGQRTRDVVVRVGEQYIIEPLNPRATKNRGRVVTVTGFAREFAKVKYMDNGRAGRVSDLSILALFSQTDGNDQ